MLFARQATASVHLLFGARLLQGSDTSDDPISIAIEHVRWCRTQGDSFAQIIRSVGFVPSPQANFDEAACVLAAVSRSTPPRVLV